MSDKKLDLESRITELEVKVSFQDATIEALSSVVAADRCRLGKLAELIELLKARVVNSAVSADNADIDSSETNPPHY